MKRSTGLPALGIGLLIGLWACAPGDDASRPSTETGTSAPAPTVEPDPDVPAVEEANNTGAATQLRARAELVGAPGSGASGSVELLDQPDGLRVVVHAAGIQPAGQHGVHLHETADCSLPHFESAGEHFNPDGAPHACPPTTPRHAGDLGNIEIDASGNGHLELTTDQLTVAEGGSSVVGRAILIHAGRDDCTTQPSGDSGDRLACGAIELVTE
jgi:Cu-Zn family superoxide dismutase